MAKVDDRSLEKATSVEERKGKGLKFWLIILSICVSLFLSAIELTAVSNALPTIIADLHGEDFVWIGSAYALASTAILPASGGLAEIFGRRSTMLSSLTLFAIGSAICGAARNMNMLIAARAVQGMGGGGILSLSSIIISDLVPLEERGVYNGLIGLTWGCATAIGPLLGGALAQNGLWRWLFYLNLPIAAIAALLVVTCLHLRTPTGTVREKLGRIDWIWLGSGPAILALESNKSHYLQTFFTPIITLSVVFKTGVDLLAVSLSLGPAVIVSGVSIAITKLYRPQLWVGWVLLTVAIGVLSTIQADTPIAQVIGLPILIGVGCGILMAATYFPVLAPLPVSENAHALAFFAFCRSFANVWGVTIGGTILQNELSRNLPAEFLSQFPGGAEIAFSVIPVIHTLPEPLKHQVQVAFANGVSKIWLVMIAIGALGLISSLFMKALPLHTEVDDKWGLEGKEDIKGAMSVQKFTIALNPTEKEISTQSQKRESRLSTARFSVVDFTAGGARFI
ncbi:hypothetical protein EW026_g762 [Hermanssonia centrifuga]|uniref:Major facilitator superfamily (MFS) profile domain-containing protein n=1 Tax=Hermanssonia centrifuga TaxID=98765 RepID=A0A4S4KTM3_9APHY|nr:hypothetical protein EW026_g762 [Hermanssonia centrifuga]